jgi:ubiquinone/menaquinone biosynthesis C-methylase UbiE
MNLDLFINIPKRIQFGFLSTMRGCFLYPSLLNSVESIENKTLLDVGTGYGSIFLADYSKDKPSKIIGVDYSNSMLEKSKINADNLTSQYGIKTDTIKASATDLPFEDSSIDILIDDWCMPHLAKEKLHKKALEEYKRVISSSGTVIVAPSKPWKYSFHNYIHKRINSAIEDVFPNHKEIQLNNPYKYSMKLPAFFHLIK